MKYLTGAGSLKKWLKWWYECRNLGPMHLECRLVLEMGNSTRLKWGRGMVFGRWAGLK